MGWRWVQHGSCGGGWRWLLTGLALWIWAGVPACAAPAVVAKADDAPVGIIGTWASVAGAERMVFLPGGYLRTCFAGSQRGNAVMGQWRRLGPGRYAVEFTHVAAPDCNRPPVAIRQHPASIQGLVVISRGELALHVSGEFPPDLYRPLNRGAH